MRIADTAAAMLCPVCKVGLAIHQRHDIEIDICPQCRGIWLDRGELEKLILRSGPEVLPSQAKPVARQGRQPWGADLYASDRYPGASHIEQRIARRRKTWLEEMFE